MAHKPAPTAPPTIPAPRWTLWAAGLMALFLTALWLSALGAWRLIQSLAAGG